MTRVLLTNSKSMEYLLVVDWNKTEATAFKAFKTPGSQEGTSIIDTCTHSKLPFVCKCTKQI